MYERDYYRQSQFEPASAVSGGMRVGPCYGLDDYSAYYPQATGTANREVLIIRPHGGFDDDDEPGATRPDPVSEPPPYGGSFTLAPSVHLYPYRPYAGSDIDVVRRQMHYLSQLNQPKPEPEPKPEPQADAPAEEHKPFHPYLTTTPPEAGREGEEYNYQAKAYDGVATGFQWSLQDAPPGMTVDRHSGRVVWTPARGGRYSVRLTAYSVYGKQAVQTWTVLVKKAVRVHTHRPNARYRAALAIRAEARASRRQTIPLLPPPYRVWRFISLPASAVAATAASPPRPRARVTPAGSSSAPCRRTSCLTTEE